MKRNNMAIVKFSGLALSYKMFAGFENFMLTLANIDTKYVVNSFGK